MSKVESIKIKLNKINFPGVYAQTGAQDTLEWVAMATVVVLFFCILSSVIRYIVLHHSQEINSSWPMLNTTVSNWT